MRSVLSIAAVFGAFGALAVGLGAAALLAWAGLPAWAWLLGGGLCGSAGGLGGALASLALPMPRSSPPVSLEGAIAEIEAMASNDADTQPFAAGEGPVELLVAIRSTADALRHRRVRLERQHLDAMMALEREQEKTRRLEEEVRTAGKRRQDLLTVQEAFLSRMSHELRTPLNAITGYIEMLLEEADGAIVPDLQKIRLASMNLTALVTGVLDLTELQSGSYQVKPEPLDLEAVIRVVVDSARVTADSQRNRIEVEVQRGLTVVLDKRMTRSILFNLVSNACKYTVGGVVRVLAHEAKVDEAVAPRVEIEVVDSGIGMTERQIEAAFRPFSQADETSTRRYDGSGVGLAVVKGFVEAMGGTVAIESQPGKGARVRVLLPREAHERFAEDPFGEDEPTMLVR